MRIESPTRMHSIGARLTLLHTLIALTAMALFAGVASWRLSANFTAEHARFLQEKIAELQRDLSDAGGDPRELLTEVAKETTGAHLQPYQARLIAADGRVLGETPGMRYGLPPEAFPLSSRGDAMADGRQRVGDRSYVLTAAVLQGPAHTAPPRLQIALDVTRDAALLTDFRRALAVSFVILALLLVLGGRWVSERGLAPLTRIVSAARGVTPTHLSARIPQTPPWPRELHELVGVFNRMMASIEEAFARLSRFSADLAHELRTPLGNLRGELEVCLMRPRSVEEYCAALESGLEECRRLNVLIDNLLFMARAEHAELVLRRERFDAAQACAWVIAQHAPGAAARGITIRLEGAAQIDADPVLFRQALANLLSNALRHSKANGEVRVELREDANGDVEVHVRDEGEGIDALHLPHLFDRFYQVDAARHRDAGQGTGLGLSIVKSIADLHGAAVDIASAPGAGTAAMLCFPAVDADVRGVSPSESRKNKICR